MNRRFLIFLIVFCSVIGLAGFYVNLRLARTFSWSLFYAAPFFYVMLGFIRMMTARSNERSAPTSGRLLFQRVKFILMGWLSFLFLFTAARDVLGLIFLATYTPAADAVLSWKGSYFVPVFSLIALILGMIPAFRGPRVKKVSVPIENLNSDLEGFKIAQISDLHIGPFIGASYTSMVVERIRSLSPNMIALTGDIFDADYHHFNKQAQPLAELSKTAPSFFASGNHEYYWQSSEWFALLKRFGIRFLRNENSIFQVGGAKVMVGGTVDPAALMIGQRPDIVSAGSGQADFKILLAHQPQIADQAAKFGFDLQLSGHTHGGQFFPWTFVVRKVHKYHQGLFKVADRMWIYVTPGTGFWGPPVRLGTTPEITLLTLTKA